MINLTKGQNIKLEKEDGTEYTKLTMGLGWDPVNAGGIFNSMFGGSSGQSIDLDASCMMLDANKQLVDCVWFSHLKSNDGSIIHTGDNLTGHGDGDDEQISVDLSKVPSTVETLVFTVNSYRGQTFDQVDNCFCRLFENNNGTETVLCEYKLKEKGDHTGKIMAKVYRNSGKWKIKAIGEACNGRTYRDVLPDVQRCI